MTAEEVKRLVGVFEDATISAEFGGTLEFRRCAAAREALDKAIDELAGITPDRESEA
jgi:hypothetical protein